MVKIASALLCDEVRQEDNGKFIAIGIYRGSVQFSKFPTGKGFTALFQIKDMKLAENYSLGFKVLVGGKKIQEIAGTLTNTSPGIEWLPVQINAVEFTEETNLKIKNIRYLTNLSFIRPDNIPTIIISLYADYHEGEVKLCSDLTEHAWITLENAKDYDLISGIYEELKMLDKVLKGEKNTIWKKN